MTAPVSSTASNSKSRRALLAGALGGLGAWAASAVGRASPVRAEGEAIVVGGEYPTATSRTRLANSANFDTVFMAASTAGGIGLYGSSNTYLGVFGGSNSDAGVFGSSPIGTGVRGTSSTGIGLYGLSSTGFALQTTGRIKLSTSGVATINAGSTSKTVSPAVNVTNGSFVLLTPKANIGSRALWFTTDATNNRFTIRMSSARSSGTKVAWLLLG
jgi:hypothetical protein